MLVGSAELGVSSAERVVVLVDLTERERSEQSVVRSNERLERVLKSVIALVSARSSRGARSRTRRGTRRASRRIGRAIAEEMGLPGDEVAGIEVAGLVHDVGKLGVPAEIVAEPEDSRLRSSP